MVKMPALTVPITELLLPKVKCTDVNIIIKLYYFWIVRHVTASGRAGEPDSTLQIQVEPARGNNRKVQWLLLILFINSLIQQEIFILVQILSISMQLLSV